MDSSGEKSLPGLSVPKWMRRGPGSDRYEYVDYCASPPSDGFFHMKYRQQQGSNSGQSAVGDAVPCLASSIKADATALEIAASLNKIVMDSQKTIKPPRDLDLQKYASRGHGDPVSSDNSIIFKTVSSSSLVKNTGPAGSKSVPASPKNSRANFYADATDCLSEHEEITTSYLKETRLTSKSTDLNTRNHFPSVIVTKPDGDRVLSTIEESTVTRTIGIHSAPCSPSATPASSPQLAKKSGNPFFTGSSTAGSGSFLFRSPQQEQNSGNRDGGRSCYETKVDVSVNPVTKTVSKSVKYVPRPSELRELNFWSPTSM